MCVCVCVCVRGNVLVPMKILQLSSIRPIAVGHSVIEENDEEGKVGRGRSALVLTRLEGKAVI